MYSFLTCPSILLSGGAGSAAGNQEAAKSLQIITKVTFGDNTKLIYIVCMYKQLMSLFHKIKTLLHLQVWQWIKMCFSLNLMSIFFMFLSHIKELLQGFIKFQKPFNGK